MPAPRDVAATLFKVVLMFPASVVSAAGLPDDGLGCGGDAVPGKVLALKAQRSPWLGRRRAMLLALFTVKTVAAMAAYA